ncbi:hypothetical protein EDD85DRAFT_836467 [Armillaria nabsnona]|nr:hypothetical protein EDD85DRAFT_836467 [Armillaria nabsnona]
MNETRSLSYSWCMYAALLQYCQRRPYRYNNRLSQLHKPERSSLSVVLTFSSNLFASWQPPQRSLQWLLTVQLPLLTTAIRAPSIRRYRVLALQWRALANYFLAHYSVLAPFKVASRPASIFRIFCLIIDLRSYSEIRSEVPKASLYSTSSLVFYIPDSASFPASGSQALKTWARHVVFGFPVSLARTLTHRLPPNNPELMISPEPVF